MGVFRSKEKKMASNLAKWRSKLQQASKPVRYSATALLLLLAVSGVAFAQTLNKPAADVNNATVPKAKTPPSSAKSAAKARGNSKSAQASTQCYIVAIPYGTTQQPASWLYKGQTKVANHGITGKKQICTDAQGNKSETVISKAFDEVVYVGTKQREPATTTTPSKHYTYDEALSLATQTCQAKGYYPDSTDMTYCKNSEMHKYGY